MSYTITDINGCTKKLHFDFEQFDLGQQVKLALIEKQKTVNIKGFRKGKAPLGMIEKLYRPEVENDALYRFITDQYSEAIMKENLRPVGYPSFSNTSYEAGKKVSFEAVVEIFPEFEVKGLEKLAVTKPEVKLDDKELDDMKKRFLDSKAEMVEIKNNDVTAKVGHFAAIDFQGKTPEGEMPPYLKGQDILVEIGKGQFLKDFEDGLIGMKKGESKKIDVQFPEDYHDASLKGVKIEFELDLLELKEKIYPDFTDDLVKEFGHESVAEFETKMKENLQVQKEKEAQTKLHEEMLQKIIEICKFDLPQALVMKQIETLKDDLQKTLKRQGFTEAMLEEYFGKWTDDLRSKAEFQVRSGLILDNLARKYEIETTEKDLDAKFEEMSKGSGIGSEEIKKYYSGQKDTLRNLQYAIREEKTYDKILGMMNVK